MISTYAKCERVSLPKPSHIRILMMPFLIHNLDTLPLSEEWRGIVHQMKGGLPLHGIAYLTIDERTVPAGFTHRRPGLHVDGWVDDVNDGGWGGGGWGITGWSTLSSHVGCIAYKQSFKGLPKSFGDCEHLREECKQGEFLEASHIYLMGNLAVHKSVPILKETLRQFVRLSFPSEAGWPISCTPNPLGIKPKKLLPARPEHFTNYGYEGR